MVCFTSPLQRRQINHGGSRGTVTPFLFPSNAAIISSSSFSRWLALLSHSVSAPRLVNGLLHLTPSATPDQSRGQPRDSHPISLPIERRDYFFVKLLALACVDFAQRVRAPACEWSASPHPFSDARSITGAAEGQSPHFSSHRTPRLFLRQASRVGLR